MTILLQCDDTRRAAWRHVCAVRRCQSVADIVENGLCIGCGLCEAVARSHRLQMMMSPDGLMRPMVDGPLNEATTERILQVCPGVFIDGTSPEQSREPAFNDVDFGPMIQLARGYAVDDEMRFIGSSGGTLTALAAFLLESRRVDAVLHVSASGEAPMRSAATISKNRYDVLRGAGSRYGPVATLRGVLDLLDQGSRFAVAGKPCDISALRNLAKVDRRVEGHIPYKLSFVCGGVPPHSNSERIIGQFGLTERQVALLRYRGYGWPGMTRIETKDGRVFEQSYKDTWCGPEGYTLQFRCKICPDSVGFGADVVIADPWLPEAPREELRDGWSSIIGRTKQGSNLLRDVEKAGVLHLEPYTIAELRGSQIYHVRRRSAILARLGGMLVTGSRVPWFRHLRLFRSAIQRGPTFHIKNLIGTAWRRLRGHGRETLMRAGTLPAQSRIARLADWDASEGSWV